MNNKTTFPAGPIDHQSDFYGDDYPYGPYNSNPYSNSYGNSIYNQVVEKEETYEIEDFNSTSAVEEVSFLNETHPHAPSVFYTPAAYQTINYIIQKSSLEIGWLGLVEVIKNDNYLIYDIIVPEQEVSGAETDITPETLAFTIAQLISEDKNPNHLRYWGHSHVNMAVSPSHQDEEEFQEFLDPAQISDFFIRGIYNKHGHCKVDIADIADNRLYQCVQNSIQVQPMEIKRAKELDSVIKEKVTTSKLQITFKPSKKRGKK